MGRSKGGFAKLALMAGMGFLLEEASKTDGRKKRDEPLEDVVKGPMNASIPEEGNNVITSSSSHQLGDIVDMYFNIGGKESSLRGTFTEPQTALLSFYDSNVKEVQKDQSRHMGGPYEEHIKDMLQIYFDVSSQLKLDPNFRFVASMIIHDYFEDHPEMKKLLKEFGNSMRKYREKGQEPREDTINRILNRIKEKRYEIITSFSENQERFLESYCKEEGIDEDGKRAIILDSHIAVGVAEWMTRNTEQAFFHDSVHLMHEWNEAGSYSKGEKGSQLQAHLMNEMGVESGNEPTEYYLMRVLGKSIDRLALSRERKRRFTAEQAGELSDMLDGNRDIGGVYGNIQFTGSDTPRPYLLNLLHRNIVVLSNMDFALEEYGKALVADGNDDSLPYLKAVLAVRKSLIKESRNIVEEARQSYEAELPPEMSKEIEESVNKKPSDWYGKLTGEGPISRGIGLDSDHPKDWTDLDKDHEGKNSYLRMSRNYEDTLNFGRLLAHFEERRKNKVDIKKGYFKLHFIEGLTDRPSLVAAPYKV